MSDTHAEQQESNEPAVSCTGPSYGQILRSSSIIGGATVINYVIGIFRTKAVAVLLGPSGVGLVGLYVSLTGLVSTIAQLGIDQSGVREVAEANGSGDLERVARVVKTLRRVCWFTGILGWILTVALAWPLSQCTFGSAERMSEVAILGVTVLIGAVTGGQTALLQGMRRIGDLARIQILSSIFSTLIAVGAYVWLRDRGIVAVIILTTVIQLCFSWYYSRRIYLSQIPQSWRESALQSKRLIALGIAFMYGALLAAVVGVVIRSQIVRDYGLQANGIYQAAWGLSGMFAGFVLSAMGTDFYPRLTAAADDNMQVNRLVNQQTEIGVLLALPGLLCTLLFSPLMMRLFYSDNFLSGAALLPWFAIGVLAQVVSWPLGMIQMAKGAKGWIYFGRTEGNVVHLSLTLLFLKMHGITGAAWAFPIFTLIHGAVSFGIAYRLSKFKWAPDASKVILTAMAVSVLAIAIHGMKNEFYKYLLGIFITAAAALYSLRGLALRLGERNRSVALILKCPGGRFVCGL